MAQHKKCNCVSSAYCRYCASVLRAAKDELVTHGESEKHIKNLEEGSKGPSGPINVQIVPNEEDSDVEEGGDGDTNESSTSKKSMGSRRQWRNRPRRPMMRYRKEWEDIPELSGKRRISQVLV